MLLLAIKSGKQMMKIEINIKQIKTVENFSMLPGARRRSRNSLIYFNLRFYRCSYTKVDVAARISEGKLNNLSEICFTSGSPSFYVTQKPFFNRCF